MISVEIITHHKKSKKQNKNKNKNKNIPHTLYCPHPSHIILPSSSLLLYKTIFSIKKETLQNITISTG